MATRTINLTKGDIERLDRLYELRKWDPNKVTIEEAIKRAINIAWLAVESRVRK